jgi:hypothetical protein
MLQHSWYFVTSKFTNFIELQYGVAKKLDIIHTHVHIYKTRACLLLEVTDVLRSVGMKGRSVMCQHSSACSLSLPGSEIFHIYSNNAHITGLMPELHNFQFADKQHSP